MIEDFLNGFSGNPANGFQQRGFNDLVQNNMAGLNPDGNTGDSGFSQDNFFQSHPFSVSFGGPCLETIFSPTFQPDRLTPDLMEGMLREITDSLCWKPIDFTSDPAGNASWNLVHDREWINVNFDWLQRSVQEHGMAIAATLLGHETGHSLVESIADTKGWGPISDWHHELGADFITGVVAHIEKIDLKAARHFMGSEALCPSDTHPDGIVRTGAMMQGHDWAAEHIKEFSTGTNLVENYLRRHEIQEGIAEQLQILFQNTPYAS